MIVFIDENDLNFKFLLTMVEQKNSFMVHPAVAADLSAYRTNVMRATISFRLYSMHVVSIPKLYVSEYCKH